MTDDRAADYVTTSTWVRSLGRPDLIDDVADQFERPEPADSDADEPAVPRSRTWPLHSRGWRSAGLLGHSTHDPLERRVG